MLIGPNVLGLASDQRGVEVLRELGLGMLFLLAGYEIEVEELVGRGGRRALLHLGGLPGGRRSASSA